MKRAWRMLAVLVPAVVTQLAIAQDYPARPVRIIVPVAAGGATDILTRALGQRLTALWGQPVVN